MPAPLSGDSLLMTVDDAGTRLALIPPLVPITEGELLMGGVLEDPATVPVDDRPCWRRAVWYDEAVDWECADPDANEIITLIDLSDEVGDAWAWWLETQTESALGRLVGAMRPLGSATINEERARLLQQEVDALRRDIQWALPHRRWERFGPRRLPFSRRVVAFLTPLRPGPGSDPSTLLEPIPKASASEPAPEIDFRSQALRPEAIEPARDDVPVRQDRRRPRLHG
ncbi:MAG TPA: hypothetical protein VFY45_18435 [Baekduia sp.]|nr:hypothetical protein [Baekduia sp.]